MKFFRFAKKSSNLLHWRFWKKICKEIVFFKVIFCFLNWVKVKSNASYWIEMRKSWKLIFKTCLLLAKRIRRIFTIFVFMRRNYLISYFSKLQKYSFSNTIYFVEFTIKGMRYSSSYSKKAYPENSGLRFLLVVTGIILLVREKIA